MTIAVDAGARQVRRRRYWLLGVKLAVSIGLVAWLARGLGLRTIASAMATASPPRRDATGGDLQRRDAVKTRNSLQI